ncbi:restriction endonuclease [Marinobacterium mangrovicola]|uniref:Restriction system protein n=1 Tax=Marinobacterium mangrovicola TaxID=1476959 RepID=A0A4R1GIV9_9GAMM|nr:restriction endonuclease [Marinobacterium mangrovicola]TCK05869.1 restriction system protein [Marinobacterium mangrovicola]
MARRRRTSPLEDLVHIATKLPAWVSLLIALASYLVLHHYASQPVVVDTQPGSLLPTNMTAMMFRPLLIAAQYLIPFAFVIGATVKAIKALSGRRLREQYIAVPEVEIPTQSPSQSRAKPTAEMSWSQFELLVGEAFRQSGYRVIDGGDTGPDGGIDVNLSKNGQRYLVQCKHWKTQRVGVAVIRELFGVMVDQGAKGAFIVTSGDFTEEANQFANGKPIGLINGAKLDKMLRKAEQSMPEDTLRATETAPETLSCPKCSSPMVKRVARKGANAGREFWGCSRYPKCRGILNINDPESRPMRNSRAR